MAKPYNETGFSPKKPRDQECQNILNFVKPLVEIETGQSFMKFLCAEYMEKPTYGKNYKIKVDAGESYLHLHLYTPPQGSAQVNLIETGRKLEDDLSLPFDLSKLAPTEKSNCGFFSYFTS